MATGDQPRFLPRAAIVLGLVSLLNDLAGEMLAPVIPLFLTMTLGAGPAAVGLVEGLAQACASLLKLASGIAVDRGVRPKSLMLGGYGLASAARSRKGRGTSGGGLLVQRSQVPKGQSRGGKPPDEQRAARVA
ncbi:MAG: MFS transporter, partial [Pseudomonadota bacterium]